MRDISNSNCAGFRRLLEEVEEEWEQKIPENQKKKKAFSAKLLLWEFNEKFPTTPK